MTDHPQNQDSRREVRQQIRELVAKATFKLSRDANPSWNKVDQTHDAATDAICAILDTAVAEARKDQMNYINQRLIGKNAGGDRVFYDIDAVIAENRLLDHQRVIWNAMMAELSAQTEGGADNE